MSLIFLAALRKARQKIAEINHNMHKTPPPSSEQQQSHGYAQKVSGLQLVFQKIGEWLRGKKS